MLLSIITHHRNDQYMGNSCWRMQTCINKWGLNLAELGVDDVEISFCDWGSETPLIDALQLCPEARDRLNYIAVGPSIARAFDGDSEYSAVHATNVSARNSTGKYFIYLDIDVYFQVETTRILLDKLRNDSLDGNDLATTYYWASRRHVPKEFNDTHPDIPSMDTYINANWQSFAYDRVNKEHFVGAACAFVVNKEMWHAFQGADERLKYWGASDIDMHRRLHMRYKFGGDLDDHGMKFFHLEHYSTRKMSESNPRKANPLVQPATFAVNDANWGLANYKITETPSEAVRHYKVLSSH